MDSEGRGAAGNRRPAGDGAINYQFQRRVTRQLLRSERQFRLHFEETLHHYRALRGRAPGVDPQAARLYEFGAGWDLITPLVFYGLGIEAQTVVDIEDHLRLEEVDHTVLQYDALREELEAASGLPLRLPWAGGRSRPQASSRSASGSPTSLPATLAPPACRRTPSTSSPAPTRSSTSRLPTSPRSCARAGEY